MPKALNVSGWSGTKPDGKVIFDVTELSLSMRSSAFEVKKGAKKALRNIEIRKTPIIRNFWLHISFKLPKEPDSKIVKWLLNIGVSTKPTAKNTLNGKTKFNNSGVNNNNAIKMVSEEILPTSAWERKILNLENKTNPKRTSETQQMFIIISLLI